MGHPTAIVLGAGISGLAAARALLARGITPVVLESCPAVGGLTRSYSIGEYAFDYTGHLLHLSRYASPADIPFASLKDDDWQRIDRRSFCWIGNRLVPAPIQYHLSHLPPKMLGRAVASYDDRPATAISTTFRDFLVGGFGQYLADEFFIPQNEKTLGVKLDQLTADAANRFFPPPHEERIRAGIKGDAPPPPTYNSQFWYPRSGGIQRLVGGLAAGVEAQRLTPALSLDMRHRRLTSADGRQWPWDLLFSSIPLRDLCHMSQDSNLSTSASNLTHSSTICINIGLRGPLPRALGSAHWIYFPRRTLPFYRVGFYSNLCAKLCPPGRSSIYVEVGVSPDQMKGLDVPGWLVPDVVRSLVGLGWFDTDEIACLSMHSINCAYIHHTPARQQMLPRIVSRLQVHGVIPIGRYGLWDHMSMEDSIDTALVAVKKALG